MTEKWRPKTFINDYQRILHNWVEDEISGKGHKAKKTVKKPKHSKCD